MKRLSALLLTLGVAPLFAQEVEVRLCDASYGVFSPPPSRA